MQRLLATGFLQLFFEFGFYEKTKVCQFGEWHKHAEEKERLGLINNQVLNFGTKFTSVLQWLVESCSEMGRLFHSEDRVSYFSGIQGLAHDGNFGRKTKVVPHRVLLDFLQQVFLRGLAKGNLCDSEQNNVVIDV